MKRILVWLVIICAVFLVDRYASAAEPAKNLDQLLELIKQTRRQESEVNKAREARFNANKKKQQEMLDTAIAERAEMEARADQLRSTFDANAEEIVKLKADLDKAVGDLKDMFGVARSSAGDLNAVVQNSLVSAQLKGRDKLLSELAGGSELPDVAELEQLWFLLQQEMTEAGKTVTFDGEIVGADGKTKNAEVTRIGVFTAVTDEGYVNYRPDIGQLEALPRQPPERFLEIAQQYVDARRGPTAMIVDPTRGEMLSQFVFQKTLKERIEDGGVVGYVILGLGAFGLLFALWRLLVLFVVGFKVGRQLKKIDQPSPKNALGRILNVASHGSHDTEALELELDEGIIRETGKLERGQPLIKLLAAVAPLLGLLGTVVGMIITFQSIMLYGTGDPKLMAGGISQALITTVLGLVVAIPLLFAHSIVAARSRSLIQTLDEQSAGLLARSIERGPKNDAEQA